jgi:(E)-4-hydroxy-3-methylbut-2-enyl-diphosphate synthase
MASVPPRASEPWTLGRLGFGTGFPVRVETRLSLPVETSAGGSITPNVFGTGEERAELLSVRPVTTGATRPSELVATLDQLHRELPPRDELPVLIEWSFLRQGDIHLIEMLLPYADGLSLSLGGEHDLRDADRFGLLARLLRRARKPVRWRIPASVERPGLVAKRISEICRGEGLNTLGFLVEPGPRWLARTRDLAAALAGTGDLHFLEVPGQGPSAAMLAGAALLDGIGDALCLESDVEAPAWPPGGVEWIEDPVHSAYAILQACRLRLTRAEFIACPSCGRTQFDLQSVTRLIRERTEHLKGVKIAIMGCVVNGPGEMADADFGYVGSGAGRVDLYVGRERVQTGLTQAEAPDRLVELIRAHGRWIEPAGA